MPSPHGRSITTQDGHRAYLPEPLPPRIAWSAELATALSAADRAVGRLAGEGRHMALPRLLIQPLLRREAVLSSRIEGTRTSLDALLMAEARTAVPQGPEDMHEVANYVAAMEHGVRRIEEFPLSLRLVRELHEILMDGVCGDAARPGQFRRAQNWIGWAGSPIERATYVPPPPERLMECLDAWEAFLHNEALPPLIHTALVHAQFEAIHPFLDGNGRVGRLLITLGLIARDVLPAPLLPLSAAFEATREEYYARLLGITERGEWEAWLLYFLEGVEHQAEDALRRIHAVAERMAAWRETLAQLQSSTPLTVLDLFTENPYWTLRGIQRRLGIHYTTAQRAVERLEEKGIVSQVGDAKRNRVYCANEILTILDAPLRLFDTHTAQESGP